MECPHCAEIDTLVALSEEEIQRVPRGWMIGQVGQDDKIYCCRECKKLAAVSPDRRSFTRVGLAQFA